MEICLKSERSDGEAEHTHLRISFIVSGWLDHLQLKWEPVMVNKIKIKPIT
jgi:hypothetical protein